MLDTQGDRTRLISRNRFRVPSAAGRLGMLALEPASLVMERKMLLGIKRRAEDLANQYDSPALADDEPKRDAPASTPPKLDPDAPPAAF